MVPYATRLKPNKSFLASTLRSHPAPPLSPHGSRWLDSPAHVPSQTLRQPTLLLDHEWGDVRQATKTGIETGCHSQQFILPFLARQHCAQNNRPDCHAVHELHRFDHVGLIANHMMREWTPVSQMLRDFVHDEREQPVHHKNLNMSNIIFVNITQPPLFWLFLFFLFLLLRLSQSFFLFSARFVFFFIPFFPSFSATIAYHQSPLQNNHNIALTPSPPWKHPPERFSLSPKKSSLCFPIHIPKIHLLFPYFTTSKHTTHNMDTQKSPIIDTWHNDSSVRGCWWCNSAMKVAHNVSRLRPTLRKS